jgi:hypothetical protein
MQLAASDAQLLSFLGLETNKATSKPTTQADGNMQADTSAKDTRYIGIHQCMCPKPPSWSTHLFVLPEF